MVKWVSAWFLVINIFSPNKHAVYTIPFQSEKECKKEVLKRLKHDAGNEFISVKFGSEVKERRSYSCEKGQLPVYPVK
ncbi:hypothetical protein Q4029_16390 [Acinetobacter baumannii]|uniref:Uncharacterized protein n=1 Tax=Acinetobacter baumannii TaxID=470 RepID=A0A1S2G0Q6_ACIBA|nr:hypothetical protein [Acinetobacter baumannii]AWO68451.1 hypothetical protein [Acinetobacter baumannii]MCE6437438.1 hypothetical protein [Acinetobacter baumannii]MCZ0626181.1 hypothetical protein [Acinetobacter baumannii]MCZ0648982.1 hypothetical protein [Acinetobacter baumannii]MDW2787472.1 hypothetical protein [Acinetobacter baumannii]